MGEEWEAVVCFRLAALGLTQTHHNRIWSSGPHWWVHHVIISLRFYHLVHVVLLMYTVYHEKSWAEGSGKHISLWCLWPKWQWMRWLSLLKLVLYNCSYAGLDMWARRTLVIVSVTQQMVRSRYSSIKVWHVTTTSFKTQIMCYTWMGSEYI